MTLRVAWPFHHGLGGGGRGETPHHLPFESHEVKLRTPLGLFPLIPPSSRPDEAFSPYSTPRFSLVYKYRFFPLLLCPVYALFL